MAAERLVAAIAVALAIAACKKKDRTQEAPPDAGTKHEIADSDLGFRLELAQGWFPKALDPKQKSESVLAEALRAPLKGHAFFVAPRIVVTSEPTEAKDSEELFRRTVDDLRGLDEKPGVHLKRRATSMRYIDGVKVGDVEISYEVKSAGRDTSREIVQRSIATRRVHKDKSPAALTVTVTYMAEDAEIVMPEVHAMLSTLTFARDESPGAGPRIMPRGEVAIETAPPDAGASARTGKAPPQPARVEAADEGDDDQPSSPEKPSRKKRGHKKRKRAAD
jgi:hypothetical protein